MSVGTQTEIIGYTMAIYTKTGDGGMTSLADGQRVSKCCTRLETYGTVDELNSHLGLLCAVCADESVKKCVLRCQNVLFDIGGLLARERCNGACDDECNGEYLVHEVESMIDDLQQGLRSWRGFTLPGGATSAAQAHVCRTVCRRAERCILRLGEESTVLPWVTQYVNRLSDLLYVIALRENQLHGVNEVLWESALCRK